MSVSREIKELYELVVIYSSTYDGLVGDGKTFKPYISEDMCADVTVAALHRGLSILYYTDWSTMKSDSWGMFQLSYDDITQLLHWRRYITRYLNNTDETVVDFPNDLPWFAEEYFVGGWDTIREGFYILVNCYQRKMAQYFSL